MQAGGKEKCERWTSPAYRAAARSPAEQKGTAAEPVDGDAFTLGVLAHTGNRARGAPLVFSLVADDPRILVAGGGKKWKRAGSAVA
jgi:hypothetical protein